MMKKWFVLAFLSLAGSTGVYAQATPVPVDRVELDRIVAKIDQDVIMRS